MKGLIAVLIAALVVVGFFAGIHRHVHNLPKGTISTTGEGQVLGEVHVGPDFDGDGKPD